MKLEAETEVEVELPEFLVRKKSTQQERAPGAPVVVKERVLLNPRTPPEKILTPEEQEAKRTKGRHRIARMKAKLAASNIPKSNRRWDPRVGRFVDDRIMPPAKLLHIASVSGIPLERVCKHLNQPIPEGSKEPKGATMNQDEPAIQPQTGETDDMTKKKAAKKPAKKKAAKTKRAEGELSPTLQKIADMLSRKDGASAEELCKALSWKGISVTMRAKDAGLKVRKERVDGVNRYYVA